MSLPRVLGSCLSPRRLHGAGAPGAEQQIENLALGGKKKNGLAPTQETPIVVQLSEEHVEVTLPTVGLVANTVTFRDRLAQERSRLCAGLRNHDALVPGCFTPDSRRFGSPVAAVFFGLDL